MLQLPDTYILESVPILSIEIEKGLSSTQTEELQALADRVAIENIGMPRYAYLSIYMQVCMYVQYVCFMF